jgi:putative ABC transport system ATP-binding protein
MSAAEPLVQARSLSRGFGEGPSRVHALVDLELHIAAGEFVAIAGPSGSGKTTLLQLLGALDRGYEGSLKIGGRELRELGDRQLSRFRNSQVGFVFQAFNLLPALDVGGNVTMPAHFGARLDPAKAAARARLLLERVGLAGFWSKMPLTLSGGERQRVAIARALLLEPTMLMCDEPTGSLDAESATMVLDLFAEVAAERGTTLVLVTHHASVSARADRVLRLSSGRLLAEGSATERRGETP